MHSRCIIIALAIVAGLGCSSSGSRPAQPTETIEQGNQRTWYRGLDIEIEVDHWWAQRHLGEELMLLEVAFAGGRRSSLVKLENIRLISPDGHQVPPLDQAGFRQVYGELRLALSQTDAWPVDPKQDYPMATAPEPARQWHFTAASRRHARRQRIAAVMVVNDSGRRPQVSIRRAESTDALELEASFPHGDATARIRLNPASPTQESPLIEMQYRTASGAVQWLMVRPRHGLVPE